MSNTTPKNLTPFAQAAMTLDSDFQELEQLSGQLERLSLESDSGLDRAKKILAQFGDCGGRIGDRLQSLAKTLDEARCSAEKAAQSIGARAAEVQERQQKSDQMTERFNALNDMVRTISTGLTKMKKQTGDSLTPQEQSLLTEKLPELDAQMRMLSEEAGKLKEEAREANLKTIERNADSLGQTLNSARRKLGAFIPSSNSSSLLQ